jgi:hypothetical protein
METQKHIYEALEEGDSGDEIDKYDCDVVNVWFDCAECGEEYDSWEDIPDSPEAAQ